MTHQTAHSSTDCPKCLELSDALDRALHRAHHGETSAMLAVAKLASGIRFHRTHCPLGGGSNSHAGTRNAHQSRAA